MKKTFLLPLIAVIATIFILASCIKSNDTPRCTGNSVERDFQVVDSFLNATGQTASFTKDADNYAYYSIQQQGTGSLPTIDSLVAFNYVGTLLNGTIVDSATLKVPATYSIRQILQGTNLPGLALAQYALPKINAGGSIKVIFISNRIFGCDQVTIVKPIPPNSQLIYTYSLAEVKRSF